jgi:AcrR family transcriptional regulator
MFVKWKIFGYSGPKGREASVLETKDPSPRRSPPTGGYARGEETRARIIAAALAVFGDTGYVRASTRQIAEAAGVTPPALQYYFESKEGLHRACVDFILETATRMLKPALDGAEAALADQRPQTSVEALCSVLDALVDVSLFSRDSPAWTRFSARAQTEEDSPSGALIRHRLTMPIHDLCARLVACATGSPVNDAVQLRTRAIISQVAAFNIHQDSTLAALGWPDFAGPRCEAVKAVLRAHTRGALGVDVAYHSAGSAAPKGG